MGGEGIFKVLNQNGTFRILQLAGKKLSENEGEKKDFLRQTKAGRIHYQLTCIIRLDKVWCWKSHIRSA